MDRSGAGAPAWVGAAALAAALPVAEAVDALEAALRAGLDPERDAERTRLGTPSGELLLMPSTSAGATGAKLVTVAPGNPAAGLPLVHGVYVLFDGATLAPTAVLDGAGLTALRTPAVTALAVRCLRPRQPARVALLGTGVQARGHLTALGAVLDLGRVDVLGRDAAAVTAVAARARATGCPSGAVDLADRRAVRAAVAAADVVVCATSSPTPLFDGAALAPHAVVAAIGSHTPTTREVDSAAVARSTVVVESRASALRESGTVLLPMAEGALAEDDLLTLADVVRGAAALDLERPRLFTGTGMAWQDLVVASAVLARLTPITPRA